MKTRYYILCALIVLLGLPATLWGQQADMKPSVSIGVDGGYLLRQLASSSDSASFLSPYLVQADVDLGKLTLRAGLGGRYRYEEVNREGFSDRDIITERSVSGRVGLAYQVEAADNWTILFGLDGVGDWEEIENAFDSGFDKVSTIQRSVQMGGGPMMGIRFHLNEHLSLYTEAAFYWLDGTSQINRQFANFPEFDDTLQSNRIRGLQTYLPARLYVMYTF